MNKTTKIVSFFAAMFFAVFISVPTMAATMTAMENAEGNGKESVYTYYVMMKVGEKDGATEYYVEQENLADALLKLKINKKPFCTVTKVLGKDFWSVELNEEADFTEEEISAALASIKECAIESGTVENYEIELEDGALVLIESNIGTTLVMETIPVALLNNKNEVLSLTLDADKNNAEIGETINYTITAYFPPSQDHMNAVINGTLSDGVTLGDSYTMEWTNESGVKEKSTQKWTKNANEQKNTAYTATISSDIVAKATEKDRAVTISYTAVLNQNAQANEAEINNISLTCDVLTAISSHNVYTFGFDLNKVNGVQDPLEGVKFTLTKEDNGTKYYTMSNTEIVGFRENKYELTTDKNGKISFVGLAAGSYILTETEAADGYLRLETPINVTIDNDGKVSISEEKDAECKNDGNDGNDENKENIYYYGTITVTNKEGVTIAETGGAGTMVYYGMGSLLLVTAGILFAVLRRNSRSVVL